MDIISQMKYIRISPKKIKELGRLTVGLSPELALNRLEFLTDKPSQLLSKAIKSAKANAVNNHKLNTQNLIIKEIIVGKGPFFKRWQPVSRGMAHQIKKRTSHLTIKLTEKSPENKTISKENKAVLSEKGA